MLSMLLFCSKLSKRLFLPVIGFHGFVGSGGRLLDIHGVVGCGWGKAPAPAFGWFPKHVPRGNALYDAFMLYKRKWFHRSYFSPLKIWLILFPMLLLFVLVSPDVWSSWFTPAWQGLQTDLHFASNDNITEKIKMTDRYLTLFPQLDRSIVYLTLKKYWLCYRTGKEKTKLNQVSPNYKIFCTEGQHFVFRQIICNINITKWSLHHYPHCHHRHLLCHCCLLNQLYKFYCYTSPAIMEFYLLTYSSCNDATNTSEYTVSNGRVIGE
jgi:hypothetical protein